MMQRETVHALDLVPCTFFCALLKRREASQMFLEFAVYFFSEFDLQLSKLEQIPAEGSTYSFDSHSSYAIKPV